MTGQAPGPVVANAYAILRLRQNARLIDDLDLDALDEQILSHQRSLSDEAEIDPDHLFTLVAFAREARTTLKGLTR